MNRRFQVSRGAPVLLLFLLAACAVNSLYAPPDWPQLRRVYMPFDDTPAMVEEGGRRGLDVSLYGLVTFEGWAHANFCDMTCTIGYVRGGEHVLTHELEHCDGRDHVGASTMRDSWEQYKRDPAGYCKKRGRV